MNNNPQNQQDVYDIQGNYHNQMPYTPYAPSVPSLASLANFNSLNAAGLGQFTGGLNQQEAVRQEMEKFKQESIAPLLAQLNDLKPMMERQQKEDIQKTHEMKKADFMSDLDFLVGLYPLLSSLIDKPRLAKLVDLYKGEIIDYAIRSGSPVKGSIEGAKRVAIRDLINFSKTKPGQQFATLLVDSLVGWKELQREQGL